MGCHPSHWRTPSFFKIVIAPPTSTYIPVISHYLQLWDGTPPGTLTGKACSWLVASPKFSVWSFHSTTPMVLKLVCQLPQDPHHELMAGCPNLQGGSGSAQSWQLPAGSTMIHIENINNCQVVWNIFEYFPQYVGWWSNLTKSYFSGGVGIPPIRQCQENIQLELLSSSDSPSGWSPGVPWNWNSISQVPFLKFHETLQLVSVDTQRLPGWDTSRFPRAGVSCGLRWSKRCGWKREE